MTEERPRDRSAMSELLRDYLLSTGDSDILMVAKQEAAKEMERRKILEEHDRHFKTRLITEKGRKPRFETYVLVDGKRKPIRRAKKEELEEAIISHYSLHNAAPPVTSIKELYPKWREYRKATKSANTVKKDDWVWGKYYDGTTFVERDICSLNTPDITVWLMNRSSDNEMTQKQFRQMKSLLNTLLDYAVELSIIARNPAREIHGISMQMFKHKERPGRAEQIFEDDVQAKFVKYCWDMFYKTDNSVYLGIILNFMVGARIGELAAIKISDIDRGRSSLTLQRSEVDQKEDMGGRMSNTGVVVVPYLKKGHRSRTVPLPQAALNVVDVIKEHHARNRFDTDWLLVNSSGERVKRSAISDTIGRANKALGLPNRGNHAIRRTVITEMIQSMLFTQKEIQTYFGHEDFSTTSRYYDFALNDISENIVKMDEVFGERMRLGNIG